MRYVFKLILFYPYILPIFSKVKVDIFSIFHNIFPLKRKSKHLTVFGFTLCCNGFRLPYLFCKFPTFYSNSQQIFNFCYLIIIKLFKTPIDLFSFIEQIFSSVLHYFIFGYSLITQKIII